MMVVPEGTNRGIAAYRSRSPLLFLSAALVFSLVSFFLHVVDLVPDRTPVNWDMAGHLLRAQEFQVALRNRDVGAVFELLRIWSVYPPLYHFSLGTWMALFGGQKISIELFMWLTHAVAICGCYLGMTTLKSRFSNVAFLAVAFTITGLAHFGALSHAYMLDAPAAAMALLSLGLLARWYGRPYLWLAVVVSISISATVLTKYNVGLPLCVSVGALGIRALLRRDWRQLAILVGIGLFVVVVWAGFLQWKHEGWRSFRDFSQNRSNSSGMAPWARGLEYVRLYCSINYRFVMVPIVIGVLSILGTLRFRNPFWLVCATYVCATFGVICNHSYLLDRLSLTIGIVLVALSGFGVLVLLERLYRARPGSACLASWTVLLAAGLFTLTNGSAVEARIERLYPGINGALAPVSEFVQDAMAGQKRVKVVGTFNNFSENWAEILWNRGDLNQPRLPIELEFYYPLARQRTGLDSSCDPAYKAALDRQLPDMLADEIIALEPLEGSVWQDGDYRKWNAWKLNYIRELRTNASVVLVDEKEFPDALLRISVFRVAGEYVRYGDGWGAQEDWGRWAMSREVHVRLPGAAETTTMVIRAASFNNQTEPQTCRVLHGEHVVAEICIEGKPWQWRDYEVEVPASEMHPIDLKLQFSGIWPGSATDPRLLAMPVQRVSVR